MSYAVMPMSDWQNILASVKAKTGKSDNLVSGSVPSEIDSISGGSGYGDIPTYHYVESSRVLDNILAFRAAHPNNLVFGVTSDIHIYNANTTYESASKTSAKHAAFALETVGAMAECDFIANLGDNCWENGIDTDNALIGAKYSINALKPAFARLTRYNLVGNHDKSNDTQAQFSLIGSYNVFDNYGTTQIRGFGYKDYTDKKVRVIVLNTCDYLNASGGCAMSYEQKDFLLRALDLSAKSDSADWQILLLSHIPLDWNGGDYNFYVDLQTILTAYNGGTTANITINTSYALNETPSGYATYSNGNLVYDYSGKNSAKIIANIHGHVHTNAYGKLANIDIVRVATANTNPDLNKTESYPDYGDYSITTDEAVRIVKISGTAKDTSATFYCIDLDEQIIYAYGYGADIDRIISYKNAIAYSIIYNLSGVTSSSTSTNIVEGATFITTLGVSSGYILDSVTITMGGVDITTTSYKDGIITIHEVTGDIIITAAAIDNYVPHWDIVDRVAIMDMYKGANDTKTISRNNYYWGAFDTGAIFYNTIASCSINGNDVTFVPTEDKSAGIGLPFHLEAGISYTFSATASVKARLRWCVLNEDGTYANNSGYSSSGTELTTTFTAPTDKTQWVMLIVSGYTVDQEVTFTNITLTKNTSS